MFILNLQHSVLYFWVEIEFLHTVDCPLLLQCTSGDDRKGDASHVFASSPIHCEFQYCVPPSNPLHQRRSFPEVEKFS